jgi:hypothetical protein
VFLSLVDVATFVRTADRCSSRALGRQLVASSALIGIVTCRTLSLLERSILERLKTRRVLVVRKGRLKNEKKKLQERSPIALKLATRSYLNKRKDGQDKSVGPGFVLDEWIDISSAYGRADAARLLCELSTSSPVLQLTSQSGKEKRDDGLGLKAIALLGLRPRCRKTKDYS